MDSEQVLLLLKRMKLTDDGKQFIEYLESLREDNYQRWKCASGEDVFIKQGYAIAVDSLIESFAECTKEQQKVDSSFTTWSH